MQRNTQSPNIKTSWRRPGKNTVNHPAKMSAAAALTDTRSTAAEYIAAAARDHWANDNSAIKRLARVVRRQERTAESYWLGQSCPGVPEFLRLAMEVPELRAAVAQILKLDITHDPRAHKLMQQIQAILDDRGPV